VKSYQMWVCEMCGLAQYHPLIYCPRCPGRLKCVHKAVDHIDKTIRTEADAKESDDYLRGQGLEPTGR
jgi:hypothetical protein